MASNLGKQFKLAWDEHGYDKSDLVTELKFHPERRWRFDFAWPSCMVAVEIQGFGYGHQAQQNIAVDAEKMRAAIELGWIVLPFTSRCLGSKLQRQEAVEQVCRVLSRRHAVIQAME